MQAQGNLLPQFPLGDDYEITDLFGNGLPCIVNSSPLHGWTCWRNLGNLEFASQTPISSAPQSLELQTEGVQFADMNGIGSVGLLVTNTVRGYYKKKSLSGVFSPIIREITNAPSFNLEDPNVRLEDMDGDGVIDVLATTPTTLQVILNIKNDSQLVFDNPKIISRPIPSNPAIFHDVSFSDQLTRLTDMSGDGMQDIVYITHIHQGNTVSVRIDYWPNMGRGKFGKRITMLNPPGFDQTFDPSRLFLSDVNGDGPADLVYVDIDKVLLCVNQVGSRWSDEVVIQGTPLITSSTSLRIADMKGTGIAGILWSSERSIHNQDNYKYVEFNNGVKPLILCGIDNNIGSRTIIEYLPSTSFYLQDFHNGLQWKTALPFPVTVVSRVEVIDAISKGKLVTKYTYHHGYWDGIDREFRGFGRVDVRDTEFFVEYNADRGRFAQVSPEFFSPPTETRNWFHQGPVLDEDTGQFKEMDFSNEFWTEDTDVLRRPPSMNDFLVNLPNEIRYEAFRTIRGNLIRKELYALDNPQIQNRPYTVTEYLYGVMSLPIGQPWSPMITSDQWRAKVFFPCKLSERSTQWERGTEPLTKFSFTDNYDEYGQAQSLINIAVPRNRDFRTPTNSDVESYLATQVITVYAKRDDNDVFIVNRVAKTTNFEIKNSGKTDIFTLKDAILSNAWWRYSATNSNKDHNSTNAYYIKTVTNPKIGIQII